LQGAKKILKRKGKRLEVKIPAEVRTGSVVRLRNARKVSDGSPGDILIKVVVRQGGKDE
jgi:DnaJ-class molecular chaperone